jgi:hypothetical protein
MMSMMTAHFTPLVAADVAFVVVVVVCGEHSFRQHRLTFGYGHIW